LSGCTHRGPCSVDFLGPAVSLSFHSVFCCKLLVASEDFTMPVMPNEVVQIQTHINYLMQIHVALMSGPSVAHMWSAAGGAAR